MPASQRPGRGSDEHFKKVMDRNKVVLERSNQVLKEVEALKKKYNIK